MCSLSTKLMLLLPIAIIIISMTNQRLIPHRDSRYPFITDCDKYKNDKLPVKILEAQKCLDYPTDSGFQCCYVKVKEDTYCMIAAKNNVTDINELKAFVSAQGPYAVVTCSSRHSVIGFSSIILIALFSLI